MARPTSDVYDLEWEALLRTGQLRQAFSQLRRQLAQITAECEQAKTDLAYLRSQSSSSTPRPTAIPPPVTSPVVVEPPPKPVTENQPLDDAAARFSMLEFD